jgi:hypothetical protein
MQSDELRLQAYAETLSYSLIAFVQDVLKRRVLAGSQVL